MCGQVGAELAEILQHALHSALGDDEAIEHVDIGTDATADSGHRGRRVGLASDLLGQRGLNVWVLRVEGVDDHLQGVQVRWARGSRRQLPMPAERSSDWHGEPS